MITENQIAGLIQEFLKGSDKFLIEVLIKPVNHIMVFIDGDHGVTISDCQALSRHLEQKLDRDREDFDLMVSSAGADRPLQVIRQYGKYIGKEIEIITGNGDKLCGKLISSDPGGITLEEEIKKSKKEIQKKITGLKYGEIKSAKVMISFKKK
jgi:ribosome maturation factor RimP